MFLIKMKQRMLKLFDDIFVRNENYMRINLNDPVKVKLTDYGISIYYHRFDVINYKAGRTVCEPSYPKVDKDGYTEFQLWDFMNIYGSYMKMGEPNVICPLEIIFQEKEEN